MNDDTELLRRYAREGAEDAFAELVRRHVNLVYSAALRQVNGDAHLAADATQLVFVDLARKAAAVAEHRVLAGWLFTSARFAAAKLVRGEQRRHAREQEARLMDEMNPNDPGAHFDWQRVRPVLDEALAELPADDREAILLRFFEGRDYASVGARLHLADNTARMRVERALDRLRARLERRGVTSTTAALAAGLGSQAVLAAPAGLAAAVTGAVLAGGGVAAGGVAVAGFMSMTKLQLGLAGALAVAGATGFVIQAEARAGLQREIDALRRDNRGLAALRADSARLAQRAAEVSALQQDDAELARLRDEAAALQAPLDARARAQASRAKAAAAASAPVFEIAKLDRTPVAKFQARPQYPMELRRAGAAGKVTVDFVIDANGAVQQAVAVPSPRPEGSTVVLQDFVVAGAGGAPQAAYDAEAAQRAFDAAAVAAVRQWKFNPGQKGGQAVGTHMRVPVIFSISGGAGGSATPTTPGAAPAAPTLWF